MQYANAYQESKRMALEALSKEDIVIKLFEEASKQVKMAMILIERSEFVKAFNCIAKSQRVISSLNNSLDMRYPISAELDVMYQFIFQKLGEANTNRDVKLMSDVLSLINQLKDSFKEANKINSASTPRRL